MYFEFSTEQKMMQKMARDFAEKEIAPLDAVMDRDGEFPGELIAKMQTNGFFGIIFPKEYEGGGADPVAGALTIYEIAKASASVALTLDAHWLAADAILYHGTDEQKKKYLSRAASDAIVAFCLTEPCAGSDAAGIMSTAVREGDGWVLNGSKAWITNGGVAGIYVVLAKTDKSKGAKGISAFLVEAGAPGFSVGKTEDKMGMRGSNTTGLSLDNVRVKANALLGREGEGFKIAMKALDSGRISIGAMSAGLTEAALRESKAYARERRAFGGTLADLQAVQFMVADMAVGLEAAKLLTFSAAALKAAGQRHTQEAAMAKIFASNHAVRSCLDAIQIFGGNGYSRENPVERFLRDAKLLTIGEGATEVLKMLVGRAELNTPRPVRAAEMLGGRGCRANEAAVRLVDVLVQNNILPAAGPDIGAADCLVVIGRGAQGEGAVKAAEALARALRGTLAVTRPLTEGNRFSHDLLIGQSGRMVKPKCLLNFGVSGAVQYTVGIREAGLVISVNRDEDAPIFNFSRYGIVAEAEEILRAVLEEIAHRCSKTQEGPQPKTAEALAL